MNKNKVMALLLEDAYHTIKETGGSYYTWKCSYWRSQRCKNPVYHDSEGWMYPETVRKIMKKMPGAWNKYCREMYLTQLTEYRYYNNSQIKYDKALNAQLSFSNFLAYLRDHKEEWAYKICDNHGVDTKYFIGPCNFCHGTGKIINPAYTEVLRELEEGE